MISSNVATIEKYLSVLSNWGVVCKDCSLVDSMVNCWYEISKQKNLDRFYYACMGWVIRNPFLNWLREKYAISTEDINIEKRYESLLIGSKSAAEYFKDERFLKLPETFQLSYQKLESDIKQFEELMSAWKKLRRLLNKE